MSKESVEIRNLSLDLWDQREELDLEFPCSIATLLILLAYKRTDQAATLGQAEPLIAPALKRL